MARLSPDNLQRARDLIALYPQPRSALIPTLHVLQEQDGYLTPDGMAHVAELFGLTAAEVRGTATFYDMFHLEPVGRYLVAVCTNIACMLQGAYRLLEHAERRLGVAPGGTTKDGLFTLEDAECLAFCGNAPCVTVNWRFFGDVDTDRFDHLIDDLRAGRLDEEVPPHGTLSRVGRTVGLQAAGEPPPSPNGSGHTTAAGHPPEAQAPGAADPAAAAGPPAETAKKAGRVRGLLSRTRRSAEPVPPEPSEPPHRAKRATAKAAPSAPEPAAPAPAAPAPEPVSGRRPRRSSGDQPPPNETPAPASEPAPKRSGRVAKAAPEPAPPPAEPPARKRAARPPAAKPRKDGGQT